MKQHLSQREINTIKPEELIDELTYINAVYNVRHCGMEWDAIKQLFPDSGELMEQRYKAEVARLGQWDNNGEDND